MNFASVQFYIFFVIVFLCYWHIGRIKQNIFLLFASWFFYACWDWRFLILVIISTLSNYYCGQQIYIASNRSRERNWLLLALIINIGILAYFKYANFMVDSFVLLLNSIYITPSKTTLNIILPVGISFYIFQSLSYSLDIFRKQLTPQHSLLDFATFVAFFPQLVAGPIVRAKEFLFQLETDRVFKGSDFEKGAFRFLIGLFKKIFIADNLAVYLVDPVFENSGAYSSSILWLAMAGYAVQIYADFSGYSNMAIGCSRMLGFRLPENFNFPYLAINFSDFWCRWHMTMSRFFRDYVYISLGGNRKGGKRTIINLAITTLVSGLWHGASWTFVGWGGLHGFYIAFSHGVRRLIGNTNAIYTVLPQWFFTQLLVCFAWVLFRSSDFTSAWHYFTGLFITRDGEPLDIPIIVSFCFVAFIIDHVYGFYTERLSNTQITNNKIAAPVLYVIMIFLIFYGQVEEANPFIYFQF